MGWSRKDTAPSPVSSATNVYLVELTRWGISNNGTNPVATTQGINTAFKWANQEGYNYVILPPGTYLIGKGTMDGDLSETACVYLQNDTTLDLGGCTLLKETSAWNTSFILKFNNISNCTILGGKLQGDRMTHDYSNSNWIYEWNIGIHGVGSINNLKLDGVELCELPGYSICFSGNSYEWASVDGKVDIEAGNFDGNGLPLGNPSFVRTNKWYSLTAGGVAERIQALGYFMVTANGNGSYGFRYDGGPVNLTNSIFTLLFYNDANTYLGKIDTRSYVPIAKAQFPTGATRFKMTFRYEFAKIIPSTMKLGFNCFELAKGIHITNCKIHDSFALGITFGCSIGSIVDNNEIYSMGNAMKLVGRNLYPFPMAMDIEDGGNATQHFTIRNNIFRDNPLHISLVNSRNALLEGNQFIGGTVALQGDRGTNLISRHNQYNGCNVESQGLSNVIFEKDHFVGATNMNMYFETIYEDCVFDECVFQGFASIHSTFVAGRSYDVGRPVLPTVINGFYYVPTTDSYYDWSSANYTTTTKVISSGKVYQCNVAGSGPSTNQPVHASGSVSSADGYTWAYLNDATEPVWKTDGTDTVSNSGGTFKSFIFDPEYDLVSFRNCRFNYNQPETILGWFIRRANFEYINCKFKVNSGRYFGDGSEGFDLTGKNSMVFKDCEINNVGNLGGMALDRLQFIRTRFVGLTNSYPPAGLFTAKRLLMEDCSFDNANMYCRGADVGTGQSATVRGNRFTLNKTVANSGTDVNEGLYLTNFDTVILENNHIVTPSASVNVRAITVAVEKLIKITDTYYNSANASNTLELKGAYRKTGDVTAIPAATSIMKDNFFTNATLSPSTAYTSQVTRVIGEVVTSI